MEVEYYGVYDVGDSWYFKYWAHIKYHKLHGMHCGALFVRMSDTLTTSGTHARGRPYATMAS